MEIIIKMKKQKPFLGRKCKPILLATLMTVCAAIYYKLVLILALTDGTQICVMFVAAFIIVVLYILADCGV